MCSDTAAALSLNSRLLLVSFWDLSALLRNVKLGITIEIPSDPRKFQAHSIAIALYVATQVVKGSPSSQRERGAKLADHSSPWTLTVGLCPSQPTPTLASDT